MAAAERRWEGPRVTGWRVARWGLVGFGWRPPPACSPFFTCCPGRLSLIACFVSHMHTQLCPLFVNLTLTPRSRTREGRCGPAEGGGAAAG
eukprot:365140-Chlamydomonas_euryale.AAC.10